MLSDREQRGALNQTEFIVAMHLLTSMKTRTMSALPNMLPPGLYEAAARRGAPPPPGSRQGSVGLPAAGGIARQFTGGSAAGAPARTQSPLARAAPVFPSPPPPVAAQMTGAHWLITQQEKAKYDQFFASIDPQGRGIVTGEQAVRFFSDSRLPEDTLATIWDLADINSEGLLNKDEFAVAMYLIRAQRAPNPAPLPAFLPPALIPPSMRGQQQQVQSTAPVFGNANNSSNLPKSATEDLFGLDQPSPPLAQRAQTTGFQQPQAAGLTAQTTGLSASRDPFAGSIPTSPNSPQRPQQPPPQQTNSMFKPFMPTSAFGATLAQQHTGGSATSSSQGQARGFPQQQQQQQQQQQPQQQQQQPSQLQQASAMDDLLGDNDAHAEESSRLTSETTELANMSSQIGNLRSQMETTQTKKNASQADFNTTQTQKRDLELRLQQFRAQYEQEVRTVKELDGQLATSKESTKKLGQELAMLEGSYQDLQTQHNTIAQALQADQQENASLKQRVAQLNAEVSKLKPEIEKLKLDARQQKGMVSINKKQLATNEGERDRLTGEKGDLEREASEREEQARNAPVEPAQPQSQTHYGRDAAIGGGVGAAAFGVYEAVTGRGGSRTASPAPAASQVTSPGGGMSSTNPFFRKPSGDGLASPPIQPQPSSSGSAPSAFDTLFGPSAAFSPSAGPQGGSRAGTPPVTSFGRSAAAAPVVQQPQQPPGMTDSIQSISSAGEHTPSATPPLSGSEKAKESPIAADVPLPPAPPPELQFAPAQLPIGGAGALKERESSVASSTRVLPPASRAGGVVTPKEAVGGGEALSPALGPSQALTGLDGEDDKVEHIAESLPGAFPVEAEGAKELPAAKDEFGSAFDGFGDAEKSRAAPGTDEDPFGPSVLPQAAGQQVFGEGEKSRSVPQTEDDPFGPSAPRQAGGQQAFGEFPPIQSLEPESDDDDSSDDEDAAPTAAAPSQAGHGAAEPTAAAPTAVPSYMAAGRNISGARPAVTSVDSTSSLPPVTSMPSPPTYEQSNEPSHGGTGARSGSNQFPPEFGGLLPSREDPTSPGPSSRGLPEQTVAEAPEEKVNTPPSNLQSPSQGVAPQTVQTPSTTDVFHDSYSRPLSGVTADTASPPSIAQPQPQAPPAAAKNAFDDFDEFDGLSEAKEADALNGNSPFDFGFGGGRQSVDEFNPAFDSPAASTVTAGASSSSQQTPVPGSRQLSEGPNGFGGFGSSSSAGPFGPAAGSTVSTPQNTNHDWDSIFSGLGSSNTVDTSINHPAFGNAAEDPWGSPAAAATAKEVTPTPASPAPVAVAPAKIVLNPPGRALTPGTEHDDPFLKRLTGMGYPRQAALAALERYDYDVNKVSLVSEGR